MWYLQKKCLVVGKTANTTHFSFRTPINLTLQAFHKKKPKEKNVISVIFHIVFMISCDFKDRFGFVYRFLFFVTKTTISMINWRSIF